MSESLSSLRVPIDPGQGGVLLANMLASWLDHDRSWTASAEPGAYGYRPKRNAQDAIRKVHELLCTGYTEVVDADLSKYFDTIPHSHLMKCVARRIVDRDVLGLIKAWLKVPVEERDGKGNRKMTGGRSSSSGTPQGGVISPLLANLYMNRFLKGWRATQRGKQFLAQVVNYADDFVILSRGHAAQALEWTRQVTPRLGLTLNETKTKLREARRESFDFLGYTFGPQRYRKDGHWYLGAAPSKKSVARDCGRRSTRCWYPATRGPGPRCGTG